MNYWHKKRKAASEVRTLKRQGTIRHRDCITEKEGNQL